MLTQFVIYVNTYLCKLTKFSQLSRIFRPY
jgi:hypothetical protein